MDMTGGVLREIGHGICLDDQAVSVINDAVLGSVPGVLEIAVS